MLLGPLYVGWKMNYETVWVKEQLSSMWHLLMLRVSCTLQRQENGKELGGLLL